MPYTTQWELDELARAFGDCSLPKRDWTHAAHLAVGLWHVDRYGRQDALTRLRTGIRRLNESHGTVNSATSGYHETITAAYVQLLAAFSQRFTALPLPDRAGSLLGGPLAGQDLLLTFYSRPLLESARARTSWVEPDVAPISLDAVLERCAV